MEEKDTAVSLAELWKEVGSLKHRMDDVERIVDAVHNLALEMAKQTEEIKHMNETITRLDGKIASLEAKPAGRWEEAVRAIISATVGAIMAIVLK